MSCDGPPSEPDLAVGKEVLGVASSTCFGNEAGSSNRNSIRKTIYNNYEKEKEKEKETRRANRDNNNFEIIDRQTSKIDCFRSYLLIPIDQRLLIPSFVSPFMYI